MRKRTFYRRWLSMAFWHPFGIADGLSTALGILLPIIAKSNPRWGSAMSDLIWQIPLAAMSTLVVARLVLSPYWLYEQREQTALGTEDRLRKQIARQKLELDTRNERLKERLRRRTICEELVVLLENGDRILKLHIDVRKPRPELVAAWESEVRDFIESNLNQISLRDSVVKAGRRSIREWPLTALGHY